MQSPLFSKVLRAAFFVVLVFGTILSRADDFASTVLAEMSAGKSKVFTSATVTNKGSARFEIIYPETWQFTESPRPHVIGRFADTNHPGTGSFVIAEEPSRFANSSPDRIFTQTFFSNFKPTNSVIVKGERLKDGDFDGALVEYFSKPASVHFRFFVSNYIFFQKGSLIELQFYVYLPENEDKNADEAKIAAFRPLWKGILETLKLQP